MRVHASHRRERNDGTAGGGRYFDHLLDLAPLALDRHRIAEGMAALQFQLWEVQQADREGRLDHDLAQGIVTRIEGVARQITRRLRPGE